MKITILGSGAWEGIPAPFCHCTVCSLAINNPSDKNNRTRPQLFVETATGAFLVEASPDLRQQSSRIDQVDITDILVSHWHFDHMYGLHELLTWSKKRIANGKPPIIHGSAGTKSVVDREFSYLPFQYQLHRPFDTFTLNGVTITPIPLLHMRRQDESVPLDKVENTFGYMFDDGNRKVAYLADYYDVPERSLNAIKEADVIIADGTYLGTSAYRSQKVNHMHGDDILKFTQSIDAKKVYFHSVSHLLGQTHDELEAMLPSRHFLAFDGIEI